MPYHIHIEDESAWYGDMRNATVTLLDLTVNCSEANAVDLFRYLYQKHNNGSCSFSFYEVEPSPRLKRTLAECPSCGPEREEKHKKVKEFLGLK